MWGEAMIAVIHHAQCIDSEQAIARHRVYWGWVGMGMLMSGAHSR